ncbi:MAG: hypothetical protein KatS3mg096_793 [Candidatus Parcubacteria bacterium]|nr:MAG: hypothetical protein KatS3mg096_793 [Candidatus Parcubacteria bacterium]
MGAITVYKKNQAKTNEFNNIENQGMAEVEKIRNDALMEKVLKIAVCESSLNSRAINFRDRDGTASFGLLQTKPETFREYAIKYGLIGEKVSWNDVMTLIFEERIQKRLGYLILKNEPEKAKQLWPNCYEKGSVKLKN